VIRSAIGHVGHVGHGEGCGVASGCGGIHTRPGKHTKSELEHGHFIGDLRWFTQL